MPQYLPTQPVQLDRKLHLFMFKLHTYLISWCQATYGSSSFPLFPSGLLVGYLQMKRESSRMTSGPRMAVTTRKTSGCLVSSITQEYWRWALWRLYSVYSVPGNTLNKCFFFTYFASFPHAKSHQIWSPARKMHFWPLSAERQSTQAELWGSPAACRPPGAEVETSSSLSDCFHRLFRQNVPAGKTLQNTRYVYNVSK